MNLGVFGPINDGTVLYRGMGVLLDLRSPDLNIIKAQEPSYFELKQFDVIFVQRPHSNQHLDIVMTAKKIGLPVWLDYDDLLFHVPIDNPNHALYSDIDCHKRMARMIQAADVVTVSTAALKEYFDHISKNVIVVPNAYDDRMHGKQAIYDEPDDLITWRGSITHERDVDEYSEVISDYLIENKTTKIEFIGAHFWRLFQKFPKQVKCVGGLDFLSFMSYLKSKKARLHIVPLHESAFNLCKSNVSQIEATVAGIPTLAPEWPEWGTSSYKYKTKDDFFRLLGSKYVMPEISSICHINKVTKMRYKIIKDLIK